MKKTGNGFLSFVRKETLHILRDPRTMLIVLGIPVVELLLFGFAISTEVNNIDFAVAAPHPSEAVRQLVERIASNDSFTFRGFLPGSEIDRALRSGEADVVVVFADDFDRRQALRQGGTFGTDGQAGSEGLFWTDGQAGAEGAFGTDGQAGAEGAFGTDGQAGAEGSFWTDGQAGAEGAFGVVGPTAAAGSDTPTGPTGPIGPTEQTDRAGLSEQAGRAGLGAAEERPAVQLIFDASNPNTASAGFGYLQRILAADGSANGPSDGPSDGLAAAPGIELRLLYNPQMKSAYNFVPGIMGLLFILICSIMTSVSIVREKETGTMEVLLVSPVRPVWIVFAKMIPYFLLSCIDLALILLLARYVLGVPMSGSLAGIVGISILYLLLALALGLFISTIADRQATALVISAMLMLLPVIMLSGMIFPVENMPRILQALSCVIPARWYIEAVRKLMIQALPFGAVLREFAILLAMTLALVGVALRKFNDKLE